MARLLDMNARIYLPGGVLNGVVEAIVGEGAKVIETGSVYDDAVRQAAEAAARQPADILVQDTSWPGYTDVPGWIVEGYSTMFIEVDSQLDKGAARPDLVSVPTGVGSLLQSALTHYRSRTVAHRPAVLAVEPTVAACVNRSLRAGQPVTVDTTEQTIMAGLRCGTVSPIAWPAIRDGLDAAVIITDEEAMSAMSLLSESGLSAGPCGAASLAGVVAALSEQEWRHQLGVDSDSSLLLISTEGRL
jgi:diaminopropionate ammonia-lyase